MPTEGWLAAACYGVRPGGACTAPRSPRAIPQPPPPFPRWLSPHVPYALCTARAPSHTNLQATARQEWEARAEAMSGAKAKVDRALKEATARADREAVHAREAQARAEEAKAQLAALRREMGASARDSNARIAEARAKEVRLNRCLEELDRTRAALDHAKADARAAAKSHGRGDHDQLAVENSQLRKAKGELVLALRKQARLIDLLKRQQLHLEASRMLQFAEEDFRKAMHIHLEAGSGA